VFDAVVLLTTVPSPEVGERIARALVEAGLAACVNVLPPMTSVYRWKGEVQQDQECQLVIKTARSRVDAAHSAIQALHPYELPEFLVLAVDGGDPAYLAWVVEASESPRV
jgi:periplasmic divalent cation tolerance protein